MDIRTAAVLVSLVMYGGVAVLLYAIIRRLLRK
jgi:hypothetical protein